MADSATKLNVKLKNYIRNKFHFSQVIVEECATLTEAVTNIYMLQNRDKMGDIKSSSNSRD